MSEVMRINRDEIIRWLKSEAEEAYRDFSKKLLPDTENLLGVRLPKLRKQAKKLARTDAKAAIEALSDTYFEETMLKGMIIGCADLSLDERLMYIQAFTEEIDNWSVCDSFVAGLGFVRENKEVFFEFLQKYIFSEEEYKARFGLVSLLWYYTEPEYCDRLMTVFKTVRPKGYYAKMALAWAMAEACSLWQDKILSILSDYHDEWVRKKTVSKICESNKTDAQIKARVRALKVREGKLCTT